jgi:hypothetical protein
MKLSDDEKLILISDVLKAAVKWWEWNTCYKTKKEHLQNPTVNCVKEVDRDLAIAVSNYIKGNKK